LTLTNQPQYLTPDGSNDLLAVAAAWQRLPGDIEMRKPGVLTLHVPLKNPLSKVEHARLVGVSGRSQFGPAAKADPGKTADLTIRLEAVGRSVDPQPAKLGLEVRGLGHVAQSTMLVTENPLRATLLPVTRASLPVMIASLSSDGFDGRVAVTRSDGIRFRSDSTKVHLTPGSGSATAELQLDQAPEAAYDVGISLIDEDGNTALEVPPSRFVPIGNLSDYKLTGSAQPGGITLAAALPPEGPPEPGMSALKLSFNVPPGELSAGLATTGSAASVIPGEPKALGLWIDGDGSGVLPYLSFVDSTGQAFAEGGGPIDWKGWRYVLIFMDAPQASHSGGAKDGVIHYPIRWDNLLMLRNPSDRQISGVIYLSGATLIYGPVSDSR